jgi:hypothetical protein
MSAAPDGDLTRQRLTGADGARTDTGMHLLFLDESGKIDQGGLFALGGIAVRDTDWPQLRRLWQQTLSAAGWPLHAQRASRVGNSEEGSAFGTVGLCRPLVGRYH